MNIIYIYIYTYTNLLCAFFWFHDVAQCQARTLAKRILYSTHWGVFFISPGQCHFLLIYVIHFKTQNQHGCIVLYLWCCVFLCVCGIAQVSHQWNPLPKGIEPEMQRPTGPAKHAAVATGGVGVWVFAQWFLGAKGFVWLKIPCQKGYIFCCYQLIPLEFQLGSSRI